VAPASSSTVPQLALRLLAFLGAYAPLEAMLAIRFWSKSTLASISLLIVAFGASALTLWYVKTSRREAEPDTVTVAGVSRRDESVMAYLFTYVLPFVGMPFGDVADVSAASIFFVLLLVLYIRTELFYVNPILSLVGYRVYEIAVDGAPPITVLSKDRFIRVGAPLYIARLVGDDVYAQTKARHQP
jgi:hypothetical protein